MGEEWGSGHRGYRDAARRGDYDAVWWEYGERPKGGHVGGVHVVIKGVERILSPSDARRLADRLEVGEDGLEYANSPTMTVAFVSDLRESADMVEHIERVRHG